MSTATLATVSALIILPTYREADNIEAALRRIRQHSDADVLVIDDQSPDGTADLAETVGAELGGVRVHRRARQAGGLGSAYREGFRIGMADGYDVLVEMDADLSHDAADLPALIEAAENGTDLVVGSRYVPGGSIPDTWDGSRVFLSKYGNRYAAWMLRLGVADATSGFRAYRADALREIDLDGVRANGYGFQVEMVYRLVVRGRKVTEVPINFLERTAGESKMSPRIVVEAMGLVTGWGIRDRVRRRRPSPR